MELLGRRAKRRTGTNRSRTEGINTERKVRLAARHRGKEYWMVRSEAAVVVVIVVDVGVIRFLIERWRTTERVRV
jgi:hypothetical protein